MATWQSGVESRVLDSIIAGRKTVEVRLNRGKFAQYKVGDRLSLRRDYRDQDGTLRDGIPNQALVEITSLRHYPAFSEMISAETYKKVIPTAKNAQEAINEYNKYYSNEDQAAFGVVAIEIKLIKGDTT